MKNKKQEKEIMIFTFDTETRSLNGQIFKLGLYGDQKYWVANDFTEINKILRRYSLTYDVHVYIHNLDFDLGKTAEYFSDEFIWSESLIIQNRPAIMKTFYFTFHDSLQLLGNISLDKLCKDYDVKNKKMDLVERFINDPDYRKYLSWDDGRKRDIIRMDEYKELNKCSVDHGASKTKFFYYVDPNDPLLLEYLEYDCRSLFEIIEKVHEASGLKIEQFIKCPTPANMAMRIFENHFPDQAEQTHSKYFLMGEEGREAEEFLREAYHGGRTELFKNRMENGYAADVTSLYPYVMREFKYPLGKFFIKDGSWAETQFENYCAGDEIGGVIKATVEIPKEINKQGISPLPFYCEKRGKLIFPVGKIKGSWTIPELKFAVDRGVKILKFHKIIWFEKMSHVFIGFVNYWEKVKNENTEHEKGSGLNKEGRRVNPSLRAFSKTVLNALYGKFGSRRENKAYVSMKELPDLVKRWTYAETKRKKAKKEFFHSEALEFFKLVLEYGSREAEKRFDPEKDMPLELPPIGGEDLFEFKSYSEARFIQVQICAYITAYARMHLYKAFEEVWKKGGLVYYTDTDSLFSDTKLPDHMLDSSTFGKWKPEGENISGLFVQEKGYIVDGEAKFKGINKKIVKKNFDQEVYEFIYQHQKDQDLDYLELINEEDDVQNLNKFMTSVKRGESFNKMNLIVKGLYFRNEEAKRQMDHENNTSYPWEYNLDSEPVIDKIIKEEWESEEDWVCWEQVLEDQAKEKFKIPNRNTKAYAIYKNMDPDLRSKYFSSKAKNDLAVLCEKAIWNIEDILIDFKNVSLYWI
jgi:hypothetical protein